MGGKAKFQKHTAKELNKKMDQKSKGGGNAGKAARTAVKLSYQCDICKVMSPDIKTAEQHFTNKHPRSTFNREEVEAKAAASAPKEVAKTHHSSK